MGAFCSMSSTAVVVKCLMDYRSQHTVHGQVMLGVLILQDCALGLILAIIPNLTLNQCAPSPAIRISTGCYCAPSRGPHPLPHPCARCAATAL